VSVSGFPVSLFDRLVFSILVFSVTRVDTDEQIIGSCPHFYQTFKMWQSLRADNVFVRLYSLLYQQLLQYKMFKSFTVPSALLTQFPKKFHTKLLASDIIFTKLSTKTLFRWCRRISLEYV